MMRTNILWRCLLVIGALFLFFSCAELHFSALTCLDDEEGDNPACHNGDTDLLVKKPVDVLFVMNNSEKMQKLNVPVTANLNRFLDCIKPADWQVGFISPVHKETARMGALMPLEDGGQLSSQKTIQADTADYKTLFNHSVSLSSGCDLPPYCEEEHTPPLTVLKTFMDSPEQNFMREDTPLAVVFISLAEDEQDAEDEEDQENKATAEDTLSSIQTGYSGPIEKFVHFTITDPGTYEDCVNMTGDALAGGVSKGANKLAGLGTAFGLMTANPLVLIGASLFGAVVNAGLDTEETALANTKNLEISRLASLTGGRVLNLCHPAFGQALAYSVLEHIKMKDRLPPACKQIEREEKKEKLSEKIEI